MIRSILHFGGESARVFFEGYANRSRPLCLITSDPSLHQTQALHGEKHPRSCISERRVGIPSCMSACHNHEKEGTMPFLFRARTTPSVLRNIAANIKCTGNGRKRKSCCLEVGEEHFFESEERGEYVGREGFMDVLSPVGTLKKKSRGSNYSHSSCQEKWTISSEVLPLQHCPFKAKRNESPFSRSSLLRACAPSPTSPLLQFSDWVSERKPFAFAH